MKRFIIRLNSEVVPPSSLAVPSPSEGIFLSHISDLHTWQPERFENPITVASLMMKNRIKDLKQIQGFLNVKYNRGPNLYQVQVLQKVLEQVAKSIKTNQNHHLLCSGDITNISHLEEFKLAKEMLVDNFGKLIGLENEENLFKYCTLIPGNHDTYTPSSVSDNYFGKFFKNTLGQHYFPEILENNYFLNSNSQLTNNMSTNYVSSLNELFPNVKLLHNEMDGTNVLVISVLSCVPTKPFVAAGRITDQALENASILIKKMKETMKEEGIDPKNIFKVVLMHHPPIERAKNSFREKLDGLDSSSKVRIQNFCGKESIDMLLHGHTHVPFMGFFGNSYKTKVIDNGSSTYVNPEKPNKMARFNTYHVKGTNLHSIETHVWDPFSQSFQSH